MPGRKDMKNRVVYCCFVVAVFLVSFYNFLTLTLSSVQAQSGAIINGATEIEVVSTTQSEDELTLQLLWSEEESVNAPNLPEPDIFFSRAIEQKLTRIEPLATRCARFGESVGRGIQWTQRADWDKCGRPNNAYATLVDQTNICVRHRHPHDFLVAGDILSFILARLLGLAAVPCVTLRSVAPASKWGASIKRLGWSENDTVALIEWIPGLQKRKLPAELLTALVKGKTVNAKDIRDKSDEYKFEFAQWTDMVVFDYLTGHYDRFASLQDEADKQNNTELLFDRVRNAAFDSGGNLWLFDNEAGMLDAYILMYQTSQDNNHLRFQRFHRQMLRSLCIFRKGTVQGAIRLYQKGNSVSYLLQNAFAQEPLLANLRFDSSPRFDFLLKTFQTRLTNLVAHWKQCADTMK